MPQNIRIQRQRQKLKMSVSQRVKLCNPVQREDHEAKALVKFKELVTVNIGTHKDRHNTSKFHQPKPNLYSTHLVFIGLSEGTVFNSNWSAIHCNSFHWLIDVHHVFTCNGFPLNRCFPYRF